ncbi:uroporphyrinogen-III C-methyltransferase [Aeromicrobium sp. 50.2.37]|uniref:uroporphyrinogen-III C-methyltransferase n=1 Tax=Aeromicrobium sp. 50.2.37 TaxID=2969305 RepID=UPI0021502E83|nr:uroporphyrinogen-III C-methyltransferase [Aeromicrobium sp. 50.2.37]MCR4515007.1 uroporphyrinogen-III C-methyltransferase [Aeromicrobium sp. 50.2.37]
MSRRVLVAGGGLRAAAAASSALAEGDTVTVVAPDLVATLEDLVHRGLVSWRRGELSLDDVLAADVVLRVPADGADRRPRPGTPAGAVGDVVLVGAGPGDPDLMTVGGLRTLAEADVVVTDRLVPLAALDAVRPDAQVVDVAKIPGGRSTGQDAIDALLVEHALAGRRVVRLKGGDPFVFGRGGEEAIACARAGVPVRVLPGVTSSVSGPALAGIPVTHRGLTQGFTVVSGHVPPDHPDSTVDWKALASTGTTIVVLMGVRTLGAIAEALVSGGLDPDTPAAVVADAGLPSQRRVDGTVATIARVAADAGIGAPAVTVVGRVVEALPLEPAPVA